MLKSSTTIPIGLIPAACVSVGTKSAGVAPADGERREFAYGRAQTLTRRARHSAAPAFYIGCFSYCACVMPPTRYLDELGGRWLRFPSGVISSRFQDAENPAVNLYGANVVQAYSNISKRSESGCKFSAKVIQTRHIGVGRKAACELCAGLNG